MTHLFSKLRFLLWISSRVSAKAKACCILSSSASRRAVFSNLQNGATTLATYVTQESSHFLAQGLADEVIMAWCYEPFLGLPTGYWTQTRKQFCEGERVGARIDQFCQSLFGSQGEVAVVEVQRLIQPHDDTNIFRIHPWNVAQYDLIALFQQRTVTVPDVAQELHQSPRAVVTGDVRSVQKNACSVNEGIAKPDGHQRRHADHESRENSEKTGQESVGK